MAYIISKSDGTLHEVADRDLDGTYSVPLIGKDTANYGEDVAESTLQTLENFAHTSPPRGAIKGQLWFDTSVNELKVYTGPDPSNETDLTSLRNPALWSAVSSFTSEGIESDLLPKSGYQLNIGSISNRFHQVYSVHGNFSTNSHEGVDSIPALTVDGNLVASSGSAILPAVNATAAVGATIGEDELRWKNIYSRDTDVSNNLVLRSGDTYAKIYYDASGAILAEDGSGEVAAIGLPSKRVNINASNVDATEAHITNLSAGILSADMVPSGNTISLGNNQQSFGAIFASVFYEGNVLLSQRYIPRSEAVLESLNDVTLSNVQPGDVLVYDGDLEEFVNTSNINESIPHSQLTNLQSDDHPQYLTDIRATARYVGNTGGQEIAGTLDVSDSITTAAVNCDNIRINNETVQQIVDTAVQQALTAQDNIRFPIGSEIFCHANPSTLNYPGTWTAIAKGRFIVGVGTGSQAGSSRTYNTGNDSTGAYTVTLTTSQIPSHTHTQRSEAQDWDVGGIYNNRPYNSSSARKDGSVDQCGETYAAGGGGAHENSPPAYGMRVWKRTS